MPGTLVPPWYKPEVPTEASMVLATFIWGFSFACGIFALAKAVNQTYRIWRRSKKLNAYITMVWLEWSACIVISVISWLFLTASIPPSFWYFLGMLVLWTIQIQCLMQIIVNRIGLIIYDPDRVTKMKWGVGIAIGLVNVSVFCIWIPARLQISDRFILANSIWDRTEKCLFLIIDAGLNAHFMWLVKSKLVANGLMRYMTLFKFNLFMVCISISLDILIIGVMSLPDDAVYVQVHPLAYLIKLHIEMNMAELAGKIVKRSTRDRVSSISTVFTEYQQRVSCGEVFNRAWHGTGRTTITGGGQMHELNFDIFGAQDVEMGAIQKTVVTSVTRQDQAGAGPSTSPSSI